MRRRRIRWLAGAAIAVAIVVVAVVALRTPKVAVRVGSGTANLWVGSGGGSCTRRPTPAREIPSADCESLGAAYQAAQCGDTVDIDAGDYSGTTQNLVNEPSLDACSSPVVFEPAPGVKRSSVIFGTIRSGYLGQDRTTGASNWTLKDVTVKTLITLMAPADHVIINHIQGGTMYINGARNFTLENSNLGPCYNTLPGPDPEVTCQSNFKIDPQWKQPTGAVYNTTNIDLFHNVFHDFIDNNTNPSTDHDECIFLNGGADITVNSNKFYDCQLYGIFIQPYSGVGFTNLLIENNSFSRTQNSGSNTNPAGIPRDSAVDFGTNSTAINNALVRFNSFSADEGITDDGHNPPGTNDRVVGNIIGDSGAANCIRGVIYAYNIWGGHDCGSTDISVSRLPYVDASPDSGDFELTPHSVAQGFVTASGPDYTLSTDFYGHRRPTAAPRDAGAVESDPATR